jgi:uracil-DNA glycosylase
MSDERAQLQDLYARIEKRAGTLPLAVKPEDIVPGEGSATAEIVCIGEAPGAQEQKERRPFVGRSGKLLRKTLAESGLEPEKLYIANIVKARPPENRDPSLDEIEAYRPFLEEEIEIIKPTLIVTLGRFSMAAFLPDAKISQVHGKLHKVKYRMFGDNTDSSENAQNEKTSVKERMVYVLPMYHPAAGLRNGTVLKAFKEDIAKIPKVLEWLHMKNALAL